MGKIRERELTIFHPNCAVKKLSITPKSITYRDTVGGITELFRPGFSKT